MSMVMSAPRLRPEEEPPNTPSYAEEVGRRIVQARKELSMTQVELAKKIGVSQRSAQAYENGETIPYRKMKAIGRAVKKSPEWLLHGEDVTEDKLSSLQSQLDEITALLRTMSRKIR